MFIDLQRAFNSIKRNTLIKAPNKIEIATKIIRLVEMTMRTTKITVKTEVEKTNKTTVKGGEIQRANRAFYCYKNVFKTQIFNQKDKIKNVHRSNNNVC